MFTTSFKRIAKIIGALKPKRRFNPLIISVFFSVLPKNTEPTNSLKYLRPTQSLPKIPSLGLKFLNAMITPYIGA